MGIFQCRGNSYRIHLNVILIKTEDWNRVSVDVRISKRMFIKSETKNVIHG